MRLIGPNCLGVMNPICGLNATFAHSAVSYTHLDVYKRQEYGQCSEALLLYAILVMSDLRLNSDYVDVLFGDLRFHSDLLMVMGCGVGRNSSGTG